VNTTTKGNWRGAYGVDGYNIFGHSVKNPAYAQVTPSGKTDWTWNNPTSDTRALQYPDGTARLAACWYTAGTMEVAFNFTDGGTHKVSVYFLDWDNLGRGQTIEMIDTATGTVLHSAALSGFSGGQYYSWDVKGAVKLRITRTTGSNAIANGLFFDAASAAL
jgi:hypothetical protein